MAKQDKKKIQIKGDRAFVLWRLLYIGIIAVTAVFSIVDKCKGVINWPTDYANIIGVSSQIMVSVISFIVSIIGIAISLQNEDFFGVKLTKLYALRVGKYYTISKIICISIILCVLNGIFYMLNLTMAVIGVLMAAVIFLLQVVHAEIPIMVKAETAYLDILKGNLMQCYLNEEEGSKDLKEAIINLLYSKNLNELYCAFKEENNEEYNRYLFFKLLEIQHDVAFNLKTEYDEKEQTKIGSSFLRNVLDVILRNIEVSDSIYAEVIRKKYLLTRVLFRIHEVKPLEEDFRTKFRGLYQSLIFSGEEKDERTALISSIIIVLVSETVKSNDFTIISEIRRQLSEWTTCLSKKSQALDVFAVLSMHLYYLCISDPDVPEKIKDEIKAFIDTGNIIDDRTKVSSWKELFNEASEIFNVNYDNFIILVKNHEDILQYYLFGNGAKWVILEEMYISHWYLTNLLNVRRIGYQTIDFNLLVETYPNIKDYLKSFGEKCFNQNRKFVPTAEMKQIVSFFSNEKDHFIYFTIDEERDHALFETVNNIKLDDLEKDVTKAKEMDNEDFSNKVYSSIQAAIKSEWGFNSNLEIQSEDRYYSVLFEKMPEAINFDDFVIDYCVDSIFADIRKTIQKTVLYNNDDFENRIYEMLLRKPKYVTKATKWTLSRISAKNEGLRCLCEQTCKNSLEFESNLLGNNSLVTEDGLQFNCNIEKVEFRALTEEEMAKQVNKYKREDGQYIFNGVFMPREKITEIIKDKYAVLNLVIKHQVKSSKNDIFELKPYLSEPEE